MKKHRSIARAAATVAICLQFSTLASAQPAIVQRVLDRYASLETLQARFSQTMTSEMFDEPEVVTGSLSMRGTAYRVLTGNRTIVTDGQTTWIFDPVENQVLIDDYVEDETTLSVHQVLYRFEERFRVEGASRVGDSWRIALSPLDPDDYFRAMDLHVRDADGIITRIEVDDANDVHLRIDLSDVRQNPRIDETVFRFEIPPGAEVVDLRTG